MRCLYRRPTSIGCGVDMGTALRWRALRARRLFLRLNTFCRWPFFVFVCKLLSVKNQAYALNIEELRPDRKCKEIRSSHLRHTEIGARASSSVRRLAALAHSANRQECRTAQIGIAGICPIDATRRRSCRHKSCAYDARCEHECKRERVCKAKSQRIAAAATVAAAAATVALRPLNRCLVFVVGLRDS